MLKKLQISKAAAFGVRFDPKTAACLFGLFFPKYIAHTFYTLKPSFIKSQRIDQVIILHLGKPIPSVIRI